jgi:WD40 repeat protein
MVKRSSGKIPRFQIFYKTILSSGWDDGRIRAFYPESGREMFVINDAHNRGVTAVAVTNDCRRIISGGGEGMIRIWQINTKSREFLATMKEHKNAVVSIRINQSDTECVTASLDGTCIIWNLK